MWYHAQISRSLLRDVLEGINVSDRKPNLLDAPSADFLPFWAWRKKLCDLSKAKESPSDHLVKVILLLLLMVKSRFREVRWWGRDPFDMWHLSYETNLILSAIQRNPRNLKAFTQAGGKRATPRTSVYQLRKLTTRSLLGELDWLKRGDKSTPPSVALYVAFLAVSPVGDHRSMWCLDKFNREVRKKRYKAIL